MSVEKPNLLVELEALLDLRIATVRKVYPQVSENLLNNKAYRMRLSDELHLIDPLIDQLSYSLQYAGRDVETLDYAKPTLMIGFMHKFLEKLQGVINSNNPVVTDCKVFVNVYPIELDEERQALLAAGITAALRLIEPVEIVSLEPKQITAHFIQSSQIHTYICYDLDRWVTNAFPDVRDASVVKHIENFTCIAANLARSESDALKAKEEFAKHGMEDAYEYFSVLIWQSLFELELLDIGYFTEFDPKEAERIMNDVEKSNSPIDVEVEIVSEFYNILGSITTPREQINKTTARMIAVSNEIKELIGDIDQLQKVRILLAEQRFLTDTLAYFVPSMPAVDFERYVDSLTSIFDISYENSEISESKWNSRGVACRRIERQVASMGKTVYLLVVREDCTADDGTFYKKNTLLPSVHSIEPHIEPVDDAKMNEFIEDMKDG